MSIRSRLQRLTKRAQQQRQADAPHLTLFLVEAGPGRPVGTRTDWDGQALEITFDPTLGPPALPPGGPHKIVLGPIFEI